MSGPRPEVADAADTVAGPLPLGEAGRQWLSSVQGWAAALVALFAQEARLAGTSLALMLALAIGIAILATAGWIGLVGALMLWILGGDGALAGSGAGIALASASAAWVCWRYLLSVSRNLAFDETRRALFDEGRTVPAPEEVAHGP